MRKLSALGVATVTMVALAGCTGGGEGGSTASPTETATETSGDKVYTEDELLDLISGMEDGEGNELRLYSKDQVDQGQNVANILMSNATVDPEECKEIATAGLQDTVENGEVAVAVSESEQPRTLSAQSGSDGPDAVELLNEVSGKLDQCSTFTVEVLGQSYEVTTEEVQADTDAEETFGTVSTRTGAEHEMLMQVSGAEGRLLVVATKSGTNLGDEDQKELEELINEVLKKTDDGGTATSSPTSTSTTGTGNSTESPTESPSPTVTETEEMETSPSPTAS